MKTLKNTCKTSTKQQQIYEEGLMNITFIIGLLIVTAIVGELRHQQPTQEL